MRPVTGQAHVGVELALEHLPDKYRRARRNNIADQHASESRGEFRSIIAGLVGVSEYHQRRIHLADQLLGDGKHTHITRASNRNFSASFAAAAFGSPSKICPCWFFSGA